MAQRLFDSRPAAASTCAPVHRPPIATPRLYSSRSQAKADLLWYLSTLMPLQTITMDGRSGPAILRRSSSSEVLTAHSTPFEALTGLPSMLASRQSIGLVAQHAIGRAQRLERRREGDHGEVGDEEEDERSS